MKPEEKAALQTGAIAAGLGGLVALVVSSPVTWGVLAYGTYRISRQAYQRTKYRGKLRAIPEEDTWGI